MNSGKHPKFSENEKKESMRSKTKNINISLHFENQAK
jgi:hypothetical protein